MPAKKHPVVLSVEARSALEKAARSNKRSALERQRARLLLASAAGRGDAEVAQGAGVHPNPVSQVRERFAAAGTRRVERAGQTRRQARLPDGAAAAHLAAPGCAGPPEGRKTWTMTLLAGRLVEARVKTLCAELDPAAEQIVRVLDQLHPHRVASLCAAFPPPAARRLAARLEIPHSPKHGSWLNLAEIELSGLARQCLAERRDPQGDLANAVAAGEHARNTAATRIDWRFATAAARLKLKHLYPQTLPC